MNIAGGITHGKEYRRNRKACLAFGIFLYSADIYQGAPPQVDWSIIHSFKKNTTGVTSGWFGMKIRILLGQILYFGWTMRFVT
ncbi:MAG: hypothetical protein C0508_10890 [Cyanobacteria bacterium PR.023]|nr:hypothetical protein [Cyanobacteria bacterium PR.023]